MLTNRSKQYQDESDDWKYGLGIIITIVSSVVIFLLSKYLYWTFHTTELKHEIFNFSFNIPIGYYYFIIPSISIFIICFLPNNFEKAIIDIFKFLFPTLLLTCWFLLHVISNTIHTIHNGVKNFNTRDISPPPTSIKVRKYNCDTIWDKYSNKEMLDLLNQHHVRDYYKDKKAIKNGTANFLFLNLADPSLTSYSLNINNNERKFVETLYWRGAGSDAYDSVIHQYDRHGRITKVKHKMFAKGSPYSASYKYSYGKLTEVQLYNNYVGDNYGDNTDYLLTDIHKFTYQGNDLYKVKTQRGNAIITYTKYNKKVINKDGDTTVYLSSNI